MPEVTVGPNVRKWMAAVQARYVSIPLHGLEGADAVE